MNKRTLFIVLAAMLAVAGIANAQTMYATSTAKSKTANNFCTRLTAITTKSDQKMADNESMRQNKATESASKMTTTWADRDTKMAETRAKWDAARNAQYNKMVSKAKTDAQKAAVAAFEATREAAVTTRKAAVDAANTAFRNAIEQLKTSQVSAVTAMNDTYKAALKAADDKAIAACNAATAPATVKTAYNADIKAAKDALKAAKKTLSSWSTQAKPLADAHKAAYTKAFADYKTTVETAWTTFKTAYGTK